MNKTIYKDFRGEESLNGFMETLRWKLTSYYGGPKKPGEYLCSNGDGKIFTLHCTGDTQYAKKLFDGIFNHDFEYVRYSNGDELTSDDLIALYNSYDVWYKTYEYLECDSLWPGLTIMTDDDKPKYFIEPSITGPIDSEVDTYEKTYVDLDGKILETREES